MQKIHFISGLGADKRAFHFLDLSFCEPKFVKWIAPNKNESLKSYALRLFACINDPQAVIVGVSFGGMLATEIAKTYPETKVVVISGCKTYREIPAYLRFWRWVPVYKWMSGKGMKLSGKVVLKILGAKGAAQQQLQMEILQSSNPAFTRWAMDAIVKWDNEVVPPNVIHIHGSADRLLPMKYVKCDHTIAGGEHVMILDKAEEITQFLKRVLIQGMA